MAWVHAYTSYCNLLTEIEKKKLYQLNYFENCINLMAQYHIKIKVVK